MWRRKTSEEIRRVDRRLRFNPIFALWLSLFMATVMTLSRSVGFAGKLVPPIPPDPLAYAFRAFPFFFIFLFLALYVPQIVRKIPKLPDRAAMLCDRCQEVTDYSTDPHCHCGGHRELLAHWHWVPDD